MSLFFEVACYLFEFTCFKSNFHIINLINIKLKIKQMQRLKYF